MKRTSLTAAALILCGLSFDPADAATTLRQSVHKAVTTNPNVSAEEAAKEAAERDIRDAEADLYPSLDLNGSTGYAYTRKKFYNDTPLSSARDGEANRFTGRETARLSQILFDGFRTSNSIKRAEHAHNAANSTVHQTQENTALDAVAAFVDVRAQQRLLDLAEDNVKTHVKILNKVRQRVNGGLGTVADVRQVEARLQDARVAKEQIEGDLGLAVAAYIEIVGDEPRDLSNPYMPTDALPENIDHIVALALQENPQVRVAEHQLLVAESDFEIAGAPFWPTIRAESEVGGEHNLDGIKGDEASVTVQLVGEYNLYSGGRDTARRQAQRKRMAEAKYRLGIARRAAEREVRTAYAEMISARDQGMELAEAARINDRLRKDYFVQFDLGDRSLLDVLDAEVAFFRSRSNKILVEANEDISLARILAATARLNPSLDTGHKPAHENKYDDVVLTHHAGAPAGADMHDHGPHMDGSEHPADGHMANADSNNFGVDMTQHAQATEGAPTTAVAEASPQTQTQEPMDFNQLSTTLAENYEPVQYNPQATETPIAEIQTVSEVDPAELEIQDAALQFNDEPTSQPYNFQYGDPSIQY